MDRAHGLDHIHLIVTAYIDNAPTTAIQCEDWLRELVEIVDMQILMDAKAIYCEDLGNEGVTGVVGLTTSHSSVHFWADIPVPFAQFDLYSCRTFSVEKVFEHMSSWGLKRCNYMLINRDPSLPMMSVVDQGIFIP